MKKLRHGLASVLAFQGTFAIVQLLQVPILLAAWGADQYGVWLLFQIVQMIAARSDFGLAIAASKEMTIRLHKDNKSGAASLFHTVLSTIAGLQLVALPLLIAGATAAATYWSVDLTPGDIIKTAFWMGVAGIAMALMELLYGVFYSLGRQPAGMTIRTFGQWAWLGALATAVLSGCDIPQTAMAAALGLSLQLIVAVALLVKSQNIYTFSLGTQFGEVQKLIAPSLSLATLPAAQIINLAVPRLVMSSIGGAALVALFNAHRQLTRVISIVFGLALAFEPRMTVAKANGNRAEFLRFAIACQLLVGVLALLGAAAILLLAHPIFTAWTNGKIDGVTLLFVILSIAALGEAIWRAVLSGLTAANEHTRIGTTYLVVNLIGMSAVAYLIPTSASPTIYLSLAVLLIEMVTLIAVVRSFLATNSVTFGEWCSIAGQVIAETISLLGKAVGR